MRFSRCNVGLLVVLTWLVTNAETTPNIAATTNVERSIPKLTRRHESPRLSKCSGYPPHLPAHRQQQTQNPAKGIAIAARSPQIAHVITPMYCRISSSQCSDNI